MANELLEVEDEFFHEHPEAARRCGGGERPASEVACDAVNRLDPVALLRRAGVAELIGGDIGRERIEVVERWAWRRAPVGQRTLNTWIPRTGHWHVRSARSCADGSISVLRPGAVDSQGTPPLITRWRSRDAGGFRGFPARDRRLTAAATVKDAPGRRVGFPILRPFGDAPPEAAVIVRPRHQRRSDDHGRAMMLPTPARSKRSL